MVKTAANMSLRKRGSQTIVPQCSNLSKTLQQSYCADFNIQAAAA
jgi:hypothetical protein